MDRLTQSEVDFFRRSGYLKLRRKFEDNFIDRIISILDCEIKNKKAPFKTDNKGEIIKLFNLYEREDIFKELFLSPVIVEPLKSLLGISIEFLTNRHNLVSVIRNDGMEKRFHRDILQWSRSILSVLIYTQDTTIDNGCTEIIPCSHYLPFVDGKIADLPKHAGTWLDEYEIYNGFDHQSVPILMQKGEILFLDSLVFHTPTVNKTDQKRYAIIAAYHSVDELLPVLADRKSILVCGERIYCGNENNWEGDR